MRIGKIKFQLGFTLIELMVVVLLTLLTVGGVIVNVYNFSKKQGIDDDKNNLLTELRNTYQKAVGNYRSITCVGLLSYKVTMKQNSKNIEISEVCSGRTSGSGDVVLQLNNFLKSSAFGSGDAVVTFMAGTGNKTVSGTSPVVISGSGETREITIGDYGNFE